MAGGFDYEVFCDHLVRKAGGAEQLAESLAKGLNSDKVNERNRSAAIVSQLLKRSAGKKPDIDLISDAKMLELIHIELIRWLSNLDEVQYREAIEKIERARRSKIGAEAVGVRPEGEGQEIRTAV